MARAVRGRDAAGSDVVILDSGGGYLRAGFAHEPRPSVVEPNCVAVVAEGRRKRAAAGDGEPRLCIGAEALELPSYRLHRPTQRGIVVDLEQQRAIWHRVLHERLAVLPRACSVFVTEAPLNPPFIRREVEGVFLQDFRFKEVCVLPAPALALHSPGLRKLLDARNPCCTVLDVGFSGCTATPCADQQAISKAVRRLNVGGRVLTNLLLERMRLRYYDLSETWLVAEDVLNRVAEVSPDFDADLASDFEAVPALTYVLPDFDERRRGHVEPAAAPAEVAVADVEAALEQIFAGVPAAAAPPPAASERHRSRGTVAAAGCSGAAADAAGGGAAVDTAQRMSLQSERVAIPEALFSPGDHGLSHQAGLAELVRQAIFAVSEEDAVRMSFSQVVLCGALARLPGFRDRLRRELKHLLPAHWPMEVLQEKEPELSVWRGAAALASSPEFRARFFVPLRLWEERAAPAAEPGGEPPPAARSRLGAR